MAEDTIVPRLKAAGAELGRVWLELDVTIDAGLLDSICNQMGDVRLITIDPIAAYLPGNVNSSKAQDVRRELDPSTRRRAATRRRARAAPQPAVGCGR